MSERKPAYALVVRCGCAGGGKGALVQTDVCSTIATSVTALYIFQPTEEADDDDGDD